MRNIENSKEEFFKKRRHKLLEIANLKSQREESPKQDIEEEIKKAIENES